MPKRPVLGWRVLNSFSVVLQFFCIVVSITKEELCYVHFLIIFIELSSIVFLRYRLSCCIRDSKIQQLNSFLPQNPVQTSVARDCGGGGMTAPGSPAGTQCPLQVSLPISGALASSVWLKLGHVHGSFSPQKGSP